VQSLASLRTYEALAVLERLVADSHPPKSHGLGLSIKGLSPPSSKLRLAVLGVLPKLPYKRSLGILQSCLGDPDPEVRKRAREVLALLSFPDAISSLCRLFRSGAELPVRTAVLAALARASDPVATEFLLDVVRQEPEPLRSSAAQLLRRVDRAVLLPLLRSRLQTEPAPEPGTEPSAARSLLLALWQDVQSAKTS
jgi:HEAT repeat protein